MRINLCRRGLGQDPSCPVCGFHAETVLHTLTECPVAVVSWFSSPLGIHADKIRGDSFFHWFGVLCKLLDGEQVCIAAMTAWGIWNCRNYNLHGGGCSKPDVTLKSSLQLLSDFQRSREVTVSVSSGQSVGRQNHWAAPPRGVLKLNCDASIRQNGFVDFGFLVRDNSGNVIGAGVDRIMGNIGIDVLKRLP